MNTKQAIEHGRRWLAAGWTWKPGQVAIAMDSSGEWSQVLITNVSPDGSPLSHVRPRPNAVPDMRDDGTLGHALGQVREAWACAWCSEVWTTYTGDGRWFVWRSVPMSADEVIAGGRSRAVALLAAREAAP